MTYVPTGRPATIGAGSSSVNGYGVGSLSDHEGRIARQELQTTGWVNVARFGADPSKSASYNAGAFADAMAAGKRVLVGDGTWDLTTLTIPASVMLQGSGQGCVLRFNTTGDGITIDTYGVSATPQIVQGFAFQHGASTPANFIHITGGEDVVLRDLYFVSTGAGVGIRNRFAFGTRLEHCVFHFFTGTPVYLHQTPGDATFSYAVNLHVDLTNITGTGVIVEGGKFTLADDSVIESCSGGGMLLATNGTVLPGKIGAAYFEGNTSFDIKMDSDGGTGTRWAELIIDGARFTNPAGIQMNGHGVLNLDTVRGVSGTLPITQLQPAYDPTQAEVVATSCKAISLDPNFGETEINGASVRTRYTSTAKTFVSSNVSGGNGLALPQGVRISGNADGSDDAHISYDGTEWVADKKLLCTGTSVAAGAGIFTANNSDTGAVLRGNVNNSASAIGVKTTNVNALSTDGARIHAFYSDNGTTRKAAVNALGGIELGAPSAAWTANALYSGSGAPSNANGANGDFYFRTDTPGTGNQRLYVKSAGAWVGIL